MQYFPLFLNLLGKPVLVVGGGEVACRKVEALIRAGAQVTVVSPKIERYLLELVEQNTLSFRTGRAESLPMGSKLLFIRTINERILAGMGHNG